jgi:hypothetical protein
MEECMRKFAAIIILLMASGLLFGQESISIEFKYQNITIETKELSNGKIEKTVTDHGQLDLNLQLRDLIMFNLREKHYIVISDDKQHPDITVMIQPVFLPNMGLYDYSIEVEVYNKKGEMINRKLFRAWSKHGNDITNDASSEISGYLVDVLKK